MKIGMIIAVEIKAFLKNYSDYEKRTIHGFDVYMIKGDTEIIAIHSMAGQIFSSAATMLLISEFKVDMIINYGVVGALTEDVKTYDTCIVEKIVHYSFDTSAADQCEIGRHLEYDDIYIPLDKTLIDIAKSIDDTLHLVCCASGDKFISDRKEKEKIHKEFSADICEMEAAGIVLVADRKGIPVLMIKTISDSLSGGADEFSKTIDKASDLCIKIIKKLIDKIK